MDSKLQNYTKEEEERDADISTLTAWAQTMPRSTTLSIPKSEDDDFNRLPKDLLHHVHAEEFEALKELVAQLNAQVKVLVAIVDGLRVSVDNLQWNPGDQKRRFVSTEDHQLRPSSSQLPTYIDGLKSVQDLSAHELQQILKNYNLESSGMSPGEMRREILKYLGLGNFILDQETQDDA